jgi:DNA (cytosine-5)-methyltransferase 1
VNILSLFSGIGGLELGLEWAGMTTVGQVEIDPFCQRVLAKHWPEVPRHDDVRTAVEWWQGDARPTVDLVCGGFPCQPISQAGRRLAQDDERWLWPAMATVVRALRPRYVLVENVADLTARGMGDVLGDLAASGYDADWDCIPASAVGAPHRRERVFIVAHTDSPARRSEARLTVAGDSPRPVPEGEAEPRRRSGDVADPDGERLQGGRPPERSRSGTANADGGGAIVYWWGPEESQQWATEPSLGRVADGVPDRVDRLHAIGNAVVPQVAEYVGRLILAHDEAVRAE